MKGSIVRVHLENFMTFSEIEIYPSLHVNLLIAPNGCGKSSLISGIILALGGKPNTVGRGSQISSFVKSGSTTAKIEVELLNPDGQNYIITRSIIRDGNKSKWYLNGSPVSQKKIEDLTAALHIQVDNLCQVLPQDRVYEFSRMNPQMLLENTEKSVGPLGLFDTHMKLKEMAKECSSIEAEITNLQNIVTNEEQQNKRLEGDINSMLEKKKILEEIKTLKECRAWLFYKDQYNIAQKLIAEKKVKQDELRKSRADLQKYKEKFSGKIGYNAELKNQVQVKISERIQHETHLRKLCSDCDRLEDTIENLKREYETKIEEERNRSANLQKLKTLLYKLKNDYEHYGQISKEELRQTIKNINVEYKNINSTAEDIEHDMEALKHRSNNIEHEIRAQEEVKRRYQDYRKLRLMKLKQLSPDVYNAVIWLRDNHDKFRKKVYEPIALEVYLNDPKLATYVEDAIPQRDLFAFTCEDKTDMNNLMRILRDQKNLRISVLHSGDEHKPSKDYEPDIPIDHLRKYGFYMYLREAFSAPEPIMKYLCKDFSVHKIPLGTEKIDKEFQEIPLKVSTFFSANSKYNVKRSKYSGEKCTSVNALHVPHILNISVNENLLKEAEEILVKLRNDHTALYQQIANKNNSLSEYHKQLRELEKKKKKTEDDIAGIELAESRIRLRESEICRTEADSIDVVKEEEVYKKKIKEILNNLHGKQETLKMKLRLYTKTLFEEQKTQYKLNDAVLLIEEHESHLQRHHQKQEEAEIKFKALETKVTEAVGKARRLRDIALEFNDGKERSPEFYQRFDQEKEEISIKIQELQAKADFLGEHNESIYSNYVSRKNRIKNCSKDICQRTTKINSIKTAMRNLQKSWLSDVNKLIDQINSNFGKCFAEMDCAGEVVLIGENSDDFDQYGIHIKVKFRDCDDLQDLNQYTQSGGERSVATAIYMIAIQELTYVPFRCVDEINQGMDPQNERRIFDLLLKTTYKEESPQYFILTPKLLTGLKYNSKVSTTVVINGRVDSRGILNSTQILERRKASRNQGSGSDE